MTGIDSSRASALRPREISDTSWTRLASRFVVGRLHQLEVVDDHQVEAGLGLEAARLGPQLHRRDVRRVVDVHRRLRQGVHRRRDPGEVELLEEAASAGAGESMLATLERSRRTSCSLLISRLNTPTLFFSWTAACSAMLSAKLVLPTRRPGGEDDQVALLEAGGERVEVREARSGRR